MTAAFSVPTEQAQPAEASLTRPASQCCSCMTRPKVERDDLLEEIFEKLPKEPVEGWPMAAKLMACKPEFGNFCRFSDLNMKNLLYYQTELFQLRKQLHKYECHDFRDSEKGTKSAKFFCNADYLVTSKNADTHKQWDVVMRIREVLKEYNEAILRWAELQKLSTPNSYNVESFREWLASQTVRDDENELFGEFPFRGSGEESIWGNIYKGKSKAISLRRRFFLLFWHLVVPKQDKKQKHLDLVATNPIKEVDFLTKWVMNDYIPFYAELKETKFFKWLSRLCLDFKHPIISLLKNKKEEQDIERAPSSPASNPASPTSEISDATTTVNTTVEEDEEDEEDLQDFKAETVETYSGKSMLQFTSRVATIIACLLPTVAIAVLSKIHDTGPRLGAIAGFTAIFAAGLMGLTDAGTSRVEIFTATAAFSAVMVVFVQNT